MCRFSGEAVIKAAPNTFFRGESNRAGGNPVIAKKANIFKLEYI